MTLEQLKILVEIVKQGSMNAAAESLYKTQPTLSVSIKKLEKELNVVIFSRENRRMVLTAEGRALYQKAKNILAQTESFEAFGKHLSMGNEPQVNITYDASMPIELLAPLLTTCEENYPETQLNIFAENMSGTIQRFNNKEADLAIVPHFERNPIYESISLAKFRFFPVAATSFPLAQFEGIIPADEIKKYVQIILSEFKKIDISQNNRVIDEARHWKVNDYNTRKALILAGWGWGTLPEYSIIQELNDKKLVPLKIENYYRQNESQIHIIRHANQNYGPVVESIWSAFKSISEPLFEKLL